MTQQRRSIFHMMSSIQFSKNEVSHWDFSCKYEKLCGDLLKKI